MRAYPLSVQQRQTGGTPFSAVGRAQPRHRLTVFSVTLAFLVMAFPETLIPKGFTHLGPVHVTNAVTPIACIFVFVEALLDPRRWPSRVKLAVVLTLIMLLHGVANGYELRYLAMDGLIWICFVGGLLWGSLTSPLDFARQMKSVAIIFALGTPTVIVAVILGIIPRSPGPEGFMITRSLYFTADFLCFLGPLIFTADIVQGRRDRIIKSQILLVVSAAGVLLVGLCSTGRATLLEGVALFLVSYRIAARTGVVRGVNRLTVACIGIVLLVALAATPYLSERGDALLARFNFNFGTSSTMESSTEEVRVEELDRMFEELSGYELTGLGLGSSYVAPGYIDLDTGKARALAPHIGILSPLFKGGVIAFLAVSIIPAFLALRRFFFSSPVDPISLSIWGGVLLFLMLSCMSGGYQQGPMFIFGMLISMGLNWDRQHGAPFKHIQVA